MATKTKNELFELFFSKRLEIKVTDGYAQQQDIVDLVKTFQAWEINKPCWMWREDFDADMIRAAGMGVIYA